MSKCFIAEAGQCAVNKQFSSNHVITVIDDADQEMLAQKNIEIC
jgi:hypothetical protein